MHHPYVTRQCFPDEARSWDECTVVGIAVLIYIDIVLGFLIPGEDFN